MLPAESRVRQNGETCRRRVPGLSRRQRPGLTPALLRPTLMQGKQSPAELPAEPPDDELPLDELPDGVAEDFESRESVR